ncbi:N-acetylmuramoyl-L-alanine amidase [bacterium]|nr:N-acetylmuramoyl-L-alanine amidase [candidate division CSSED10-310 bacterium]
MSCIVCEPVRKYFIHVFILYLMIAGFTRSNGADNISVRQSDDVETGVIPVSLIDGTEMISLTRWAALLDADLNWDYVLGVAEMRFRDNRLRFADGGRGIWVNGRMQSLPAAVRQQNGDIWVPLKILDDLVDPLWEGDLIWNDSSRSLTRFSRGAEGKGTQAFGRQDDGSLVIVIDPGHGGTDPGCIDLGGTLEKDATLQIALRISDILMNRLGAQVILTRSGDSDVSGEQRVALANRSNADIFLAVHIAPPQEMPGRSFYVYHLPDTPGQDSDTGLDLWGDRPEAVVRRTGEYTRYFAESLASTAAIREFSMQTAQLSGLKGLMMPAFYVELSWNAMFYGEIGITEESGRNRAAEAIFDGIQECLKME